MDEQSGFLLSGFSSSRLLCRLLDEGVGHDVTTTCNINTKRKKETETVQKIKEVSLLEKDRGTGLRAAGNPCYSQYITTSVQLK